MTRRVRLTRRGRRVIAWAVGLALAALAYWAMSRGFDACMAAGHAWAECAAL